MAFKTSEAGRAGFARMKEIAQSHRVEIERIAADLLSTLDRTPTAIDEIAAEALASATVRSRHLRSTGRDDHAERREIATLLRDGPFRPRTAEPRAVRQAAELSL
jgi:hypothetical protein